MKGGETDMLSFDPFSYETQATAAALYGGDCRPPWEIEPFPVPTFPTEPTTTFA
jgi:hypothetical protein